ncbi:hypothetical protein COV11_00405 [Candidatus Woesearchaeota archaeon CG10_big_fil_rev_8_21_14_0_10_30_7]|nr:MAG: hypothetical protein COV11_00405 [Candidatus Woesearchaeota archaeon CG10_big_fil_rev_8_21_14_0_10_30_7]
MKIKQKIMKVTTMPLAHPEVTVGVLGLTGIAMGAYNGYCASKGVSVGDMEVTLNYWPAAVSGAFGVMAGTASGVMYLGIERFIDKKKPQHKLEKILCGSFVGGVVGTVFGAGATAVGYGIGYVVGMVN